MRISKTWLNNLKKDILIDETMEDIESFDDMELRYFLESIFFQVSNNALFKKEKTKIKAKLKSLNYWS